jgi:hypothetical protein
VGWGVLGVVAGFGGTTSKPVQSGSGAADALRRVCCAAARPPARRALEGVRGWMVLAARVHGLLHQELPGAVRL